MKYNRPLSGQEVPGVPEAGLPAGILRLDGLKIGYRRGRREQLISGPVSCDAVGGELVALMGRNGSGKSTLLRTVAGLQENLGGGISLFGRPMRSYSRREIARLLGFVSTEVIRVQGLRVRDLVAMGRYPHTGWFGNLAEKDRVQIREALELTSMEELGGRDMDELSDGERQRAMIARTLAQDTSVLVLDEPTAYLDVTHRYELIALLGRLARDLGKTVLFSTHDLHLSLRAADKIWMMVGQEIRQGAPEDLILRGVLEEGLLTGSAAGDIILDPSTGDLARPGEPGPEIRVSSGSEVLLSWTSRSLERLGFRPVREKSTPLVLRVEGGRDKPVWILEKSGFRKEFDSIYELSLYLRTKV